MTTSIKRELEKLLDEGIEVTLPESGKTLTLYAYSSAKIAPHRSGTDLTVWRVFEERDGKEHAPVRFQ